METAIRYAVYVHAFLGGIGLITGIGSILVKKGGPIHQKLGKAFSFGIIGSSLISLPIAWMPGHRNLFLFLIGIFTIYLVVIGNRSLGFKRKAKATTGDYAVSSVMLLFSLFMLIFGIYGLFNSLVNSILYVIFGSFGLVLLRGDYKFYREHGNGGNEWLLNHLSKMLAALIASVTAFIVAGLNMGSLLAWILPSVIGTVLIIYWRRKMKIPVGEKP